MTLLHFVALSTSFAFLAYGLHCIFSASMKLEFKRYGLEKLRVLTGLLEIAGGLGLLVGLKVQIILELAAMGLAFMMFSAIMVRVKIKDRPVLLLPALFLLLVNIYILTPSTVYSWFGISSSGKSDPEVVSQIDLNKYENVTFNNRLQWITMLDLATQKLFDEQSLQYIAGENFIITGHPGISSLLSLLKTYITSLENTEIFDTTIHQKFIFISELESRKKLLRFFFEEEGLCRF